MAALERAPLYEVLPPGHVRFLRLAGVRRAAAASAASPRARSLGRVDVRLETVSLDDVRRRPDAYTALSYCWHAGHRPDDDDDDDDKNDDEGCNEGCDDGFGSGSGSHRGSGRPVVVCNGRPVDVTLNLHRALWQLATQDGDGDGDADGDGDGDEDGDADAEPRRRRAVWADALCIDQANAAEKTAQVGLMGDIYRSVGRVTIWLGSGNDGDDDGDADAAAAATATAATTVGTLFAALRAHVDAIGPVVRPEGLPDDHGGGDGGGQGRVRTLEELAAEMPEDRREGIRRGLRYMRRCGYFSRAWTMQEATVCRSAIVQAGDQVVDWGVLCLGYRPELVMDCREGVEIWRELQFLRAIRRSEHELLFLLRAVWARDATEMRDKVYAALGMYRGREPIVADYELSIRQAMTYVSWRTVEDSGALDVLHYAGLGARRTLKSGLRRIPNEHELLHLPSWVPDWCSVFENAELRRKDISFLTKLEFPELSESFRLDVRRNGKHIVAAGIALGRLLQFDNPDNGWESKVMVVPFPRCVLPAGVDGETHLSVAGSLGAAMQTLPGPTRPTKTDMADFARKVKMHDEGECDCLDPVDRPSEQTSYHGDHGPHCRLGSSLEYGPTRPLDWVVVLFGSRSAAVLRPDCHVRPNPWEAQIRRGFDDSFPDLWVREEDSDTFVLTEVMDMNPAARVLDMLDVYREFMQGFRHLKDLSYIYGDFEIR